MSMFIFSGKEQESDHARILAANFEPIAIMFDTVAFIFLRDLSR